MQRSTKLELLDQGISEREPAQYRGCLRELGRIGRFLGGNRATLGYMPKGTRSILDVGCGGGDFARLLAAQFPRAQLVGIDIEPEAIAYAREHVAPNLSFELCSGKALAYPDRHFDIVTSTLVCHHLTDDELVHFLKEAYRVAKWAVVINDLHRSVLASALFCLAAPLFFRNRLIFHDGLLSIRRAFTRSDWKRLLLEAGFSPYQWSLHWHWAFRWLLVIRK